MVLLGWVGHIELLKNPFPEEPPVAISTSLVMVLSGLAIFLKGVGKYPRLVISLSCVSLLLALSIFSHYLFRTFDLDQFLHGSSLPRFGPDRMAPSILFCFVALNTGVLLDPRRHLPLIQFLAFFSSILCASAFSARLFDVPVLMRVPTIIQMASTASLGGIFLAAALLLLKPDQGVIGLISSSRMGGKFGRTYIIPAIVLPFLVGRIALNGVLSGLYDSRLGAAMVVLASVSFLVSMLFRVAAWLNEADSERDRAVEDMRTNIENTRLTVDSTNEAFIMVDGKGRVVDWNPAAEALLGYTREEVFGKTFDFLLLPSERKQHMDGFADYHNSGNLQPANNTVELNLLRRDGTAVTVDGSPFIVHFRGEACFCAFWRDISARKESERRINEFVSTVSHELRTPLTSIMGALRLIEGGVAGDVSTEAMSLINVATSETERLIRLVNDILDLKKIEAGKLELKFEDVQLIDLIDKSLEGINGMAAEFGIALKRDVSASGILYCDKDRIIQVLQNLLSNAIKFSPEGETVSLSLEATTPSTVRFSVTDQGCGIPENQIHKLFGRFQQLDSSDSRQQGGTGLGLAISKAIVEEHKGTIGFETQYREGSKFWFELPLRTHATTISTSEYPKFSISNPN
jgi:PAS domain S-box-containing protein